MEKLDVEIEKVRDRLRLGRRCLQSIGKTVSEGMLVIEVTEC